MAKWSWMALLAFSGAALAHELPLRVDGCAVLHQIVYAEVTAAAWGTWPVDVSPGAQRVGVLVCGDTSRTISHAYAEAVQATGGLVRNDSLFERRMDECLLGEVVECGADIGPYAPLILSAERQTGAVSWRAVASVVWQAMPEGMPGNRAVFSPELLRRSLRFSLRR